jgi:hypothetical protein
MTDGQRWQVGRLYRAIADDMRARGVTVSVVLDPDPWSRGLDIEVETPPEMGVEDARAVVSEVYRRVGDAVRSVGATGFRLAGPVQAG